MLRFHYQSRTKMNYETNKRNKKQNIKVLLDSGASGTIISSQFTKLLNLQSGKRCKWNTMAGSFTTKHDCLINFNLPTSP